jgi:MoaA/NifB/PqqE/SkfB family radical SAM enzyme
MCDQKHIKRKTNMSFIEAKRIIDKIPSLLAVDLTGMGEVLMNKDFFKIVSYLKKNNKFVGFTSNFVLLNKTAARKLVKLGVDEVVVSVDSADKKTYEGIRVGAKFERVVENIKGLSKIKAELGSNFPEIQIRTVTMKKNIDSIKEMVDLSAKLGVKVLHVTTIYGPNKMRPDHFADDEFEKKTSELVSYSKNKGLSLQIGSYHKKLVRQCPLPFIHFYVTVSGAVIPCCYAQQSGSYEDFIKSENMGNILQNDLPTTWNSNKYKIFRNSVKKGVSPRLCKQCPIYKTE